MCRRRSIESLVGASEPWGSRICQASFDSAYLSCSLVEVEYYIHTRTHTLEKVGGFILV